MTEANLENFSIEAKKCTLFFSRGEGSLGTSPTTPSSSSNSCCGRPGRPRCTPRALLPACLSPGWDPGRTREPSRRHDDVTRGLSYLAKGVRITYQLPLRPHSRTLRSDESGPRSSSWLRIRRSRPQAASRRRRSEVGRCVVVAVIVQHHPLEANHLDPLGSLAACLEYRDLLRVARRHLGKQPLDIHLHPSFRSRDRPTERSASRVRPGPRARIRRCSRPRLSWHRWPGSRQGR